MTKPPMRFVHPDTVTEHFHLRPGEVVADFGAGRGYFLSKLSAAVTAEGVVHAIEIQKSLVEAMGDMIATQGLGNVQVAWADSEVVGGVPLADGVLDAGLVINTLFQFDDKVTALDEIVRTIRSGGRLFIVDWSESFNNLGPTPEAVVSEADARALVETTGLVYDRSFPAGEHHYGLAFRKP